jgi:hypothetical protein
VLEAARFVGGEKTAPARNIGNDLRGNCAAKGMTMQQSGSRRPPAVAPQRMKMPCYQPLFFRIRTILPRQPMRGTAFVLQ